MMKHTNIQLFKPYPDGVILKKLTIKDRYIEKRVQLFIHQTMCISKAVKKKKLLERCNK